MIKSKKINVIVAIAMVVALVISMAMFFSAGAYTGKITDYEKKLFNGEVVEINIEVNADDWADLLENATAKEYVSADVTLNGDVFSSVGIRTKGNSSLTQVASSDSDRYSLQLNPNKYVKGQSFYGLDTLCINNIVSDATYMKDMISYDIMEYLGVPTPLRNYAKVTVNGEYYGLCLLLERYDNSFLDRTYNSTTGELYNVKTGMGAGGGEKGEAGGVEFPTDREMPTMLGNQTPNNAQSNSNTAISSKNTSTTQAISDNGSGTQAVGVQPNTAESGRMAPSNIADMAEGLNGAIEPPIADGANRTTPPEIPQGDAATTEKATSDTEEQPAASEQISAPTQTAAKTSISSVINSMENNAGNEQSDINEEDTTVAGQNQLDRRNSQIGGGFGGGMPGGMPGFSSGGGNLVYTDDNPESYSSIFDNAVSSKVSDKDKEQVITAIQKLNQGEDLETYWNADEILRYFAAHTFVVNLDSYVSNMQQNYYILERNGQLSILPWDYNLAFGGFNSGGASSVVNFPIDTPVSGVSMEDRPLLNELLQVDEYKEKYHEYLNDIVEGYVYGGEFEAEVERINAEIGTYVENDTTGFYTYDEYQTAVESLIELVNLRADSVKGQLEGTIPSTTEGQEQDSSALIDTGTLNLKDLGSQGGGGEFGAFGKQNQNTTTAETTVPQDTTFTAPPGPKNENMDTNASNTANATNTQMGDTPRDIQTIIELQQAAANGTLTDEQKAQLEQLGITEEQLTEFSTMFGENNGPPTMPGSTSSQAQTITLTWQDWLFYGILAVALIAGIIFIAKYPKYKYKK